MFFLSQSLDKDRELGKARTFCLTNSVPFGSRELPSLQSTPVVPIFSPFLSFFPFSMLAQVYSFTELFVMEASRCLHIPHHIFFISLFIKCFELVICAGHYPMNWGYCDNPDGLVVELGLEQRSLPFTVFTFKNTW